MSATSVGVAPTSECLRREADIVRVGGRCDPLAIGPYLSTLETRVMMKRFTKLTSFIKGKRKAYSSLAVALFNLYKFS